MCSIFRLAKLRTYIKYSCFLFFLSSSFASAEHFQILNFRLPLVLENRSKPKNPARGAFLELPASLAVGREGAISLEGDEGSFLSILGPAYLRFSGSAGEEDSDDDESLSFSIDYGDIYARASPGLAGTFKVATRFLKEKA